MTDRTVTLMGARFNNLNEHEAVEHIVSGAARGEGGWVVTPNVDILRQIAADPAVHQLVEGASLVIADGMPLLWAARLQGHPLKQRVPASEAIWPLCAEAARHRIGVFLLGGSPGNAKRAADALSARSPGLVVTHLCPPVGFEHSDEAMAELHQALENASPGIVFCAFGFPKQERLMGKLVGRFPRMWFIGCGGTFEMVAGDKPKAPLWMRKSGLEWVHRLRLEPRRLFQRYIVHDLPFALRLLSSSAWARFHPGGAVAVTSPGSDRRAKDPLGDDQRDRDPRPRDPLGEEPLGKDQRDEKEKVGA